MKLQVLYQWKTMALLWFPKCQKNCKLRPQHNSPLISWETIIWCGSRRDPLQIWRQGYLCSIWSHHTLQLLTGLSTHGFPISNIDFSPNWTFTTSITKYINNHKLTRSSLFVRLVVSVFWVASSSWMRLWLDLKINKWDDNLRLNHKKVTASRAPQKIEPCLQFFNYLLSRFKSNRCPAVTLSISYLSQTTNK